MSKKTKAADDFADRLLNTRTKQTKALERTAASLDRIDSTLVRIASLLATPTQPRRKRRDPIQDGPHMEPNQEKMEPDGTMG